jgi:hypothetical protein
MERESPARELTEAARGAAKSNTIVGRLAGGTIVGLGLLFIGVELVHPSPPGQSAMSVGIGFVVAGTLMSLLLRYVLRKRSQDAAAMPQQLEERAQRVAHFLERHGKLTFDARPAAEARSRAIFLPLLVGVTLAVFDYGLAHKRGIDVGWARGLYLLLPLAGWLAYPRFRGARYELTETSLTRRYAEQSETIAFAQVSAARTKLIRVVRAGSTVGFYVTLSLESGKARIPLADLLAARPPGAHGPYGSELTAGDVLCWLWLRRTHQLGLEPLTT